MSKLNRSIFLQMFGVTSQSKIIDFLVENDLWHYSAVQLSHQTGVKLKKVNDVIYLLKNYKMIVAHKDNKKIFTVNQESPIMAALVSFDYQLAVEGFNQDASSINPSVDGVVMAEQKVKKKNG